MLIYLLERTRFRLLQLNGEGGSELNVFSSLAVKTPNSLPAQWNAEVFLSLMVQFIMVQF